MIRNVIKIEADKCIGCALCVNACHESAIQLVDGKATLVSEHYCDGLGNCLPVCPTNAISFEEREAPEYDKEAVKTHKKQLEEHAEKAMTHLNQWPVQIKLVPANAPYFNGADLLIAADCTAYAYGNFHNKFMKDRITIIGCPKLDMVDYTEKLASIIATNDIQSIIVTRMQVPCCGGIEHAVRNAVTQSSKIIPCDIVTITHEGKII